MKETGLLEVQGILWAHNRRGGGLAVPRVYP